MAYMTSMLPVWDSSPCPACPATSFHWNSNSSSSTGIFICALARRLLIRKPEQYNARAMLPRHQHAWLLLCTLQAKARKVVVRQAKQEVDALTRPKELDNIQNDVRYQWAAVQH